MSGVQSVSRAFRLLEAIGSTPAGLTELARRVDLPMSTTSRLLATLEELGAVERNDELGLFRIGPSILTMAASVDSTQNLKAVAAPELEALNAEFGEAAGLAVAAGYTMRFIDQVDDENAAVQVQDWVGSQLPMHLVSAGLVALAHWPEDAVDTFLERDLEAPTSASVTDPGAIRARIASVRDDGFAWTIEELVPGVNSLSAPIFTAQGEVVGAVNLHGPAYRFPKDQRRRYEEGVIAAAQRVATALGLGAVDAVAPGDVAEGLELLDG